MAKPAPHACRKQPSVTTQAAADPLTLALRRLAASEHAAVKRWAHRLTAAVKR